MALRATKEIEAVNGGDYQRIYIPAKISIDSQYPFAGGQRVRLQLVETTCERYALVVTSDALEVDLDETVLDLQRSTAEVQADLELGEAEI